MIKVPWQQLKQYLTVNAATYQWAIVDNAYLVKSNDSFDLWAFIPITTPANPDQVEFEATYKATNTIAGSQYDTDGAQVVRQKAAKKGWSFWALPPEITTSTIGGSLYCKDSTGADVTGFTCKIYNANGDEITTPGLANINLATCTKTVLDFEPAFDYEIIGGVLRLATNPGVDVRLWIVGAPDIPAAMGGSKEFASGINLRFLPSGSAFDVDGRVSKYIPYSATLHTGKLRIMLTHPAGTQVNIQFVIHMYRL